MYMCGGVGERWGLVGGVHIHFHVCMSICPLCFWFCLCVCVWGGGGGGAGWGVKKERNQQHCCFFFVLFLVFFGNFLFPVENRGWYVIQNPKLVGYLSQNFYCSVRKTYLAEYSHELSIFFLNNGALTLSILGKIFSRQCIKIFFFFSKKTWFCSYRQFAWNIKSCFLGKIRKISPICHLLN